MHICKYVCTTRIKLNFKSPLYTYVAGHGIGLYAIPDLMQAKHHIKHVWNKHIILCTYVHKHIKYLPSSLTIITVAVSSLP